MKIVFFTNGSEHGRQILSALIKEGISIKAIIRESASLRAPNNFFGKLLWIYKRYGFLFLLKATFLGRILKNKKKHEMKKSETDLKGSKIPEIFVKSFNGEDCRNYLNQENPDLIVLGGRVF